MLGKQIDYEKIFSSMNDTHRFIYGDRSKTVKILDGDDFINAWLSSKNVAAVSMVIAGEALNGDIPSLKQMIWLCDLYFMEAENLAKNKSEHLKLKVYFLKERIKYCEKAIMFGSDQSYYAMISYAYLYSILSAQQAGHTDETAINALVGIVKYARQVINSDCDDLEIMGDAKALLNKYELYSHVMT